MALKALISSPLEAGTSILDAHRLPPHLFPTLEYTSRRLAKKGLHITLVVARREYQVPACAAGNDATAISTTADPAANLPTPPASPASPDVVPCGPSFTAFKSLVRSGTDPSPHGTDKLSVMPPQRGKTVSLTKKASLASLFDGGLGSPRLRWPLTPKTPSGVPQTPRTPATPATPASSVATASSNSAYSAGGASGGPPSSIRLIYTAPLTPRADSLVTSTLARAARKFGLDAPLTARDAATYGIPADVLHRSIIQNELLFCSEGLTLLSLDHLYTFKSALARYSARSSELGGDFRLEDAVDELRRYVLAAAGGRRKLPKSVLVGTYEWLGPVDEAALGDVTRMYCRAYGGVAGDAGVEDDLCKAAARTLAGEAIRPVAPTPPPKSELRAARDAASPTPTPPLSAEGQPQSPQNWAVEDYSPMADEGMVNVPETPRVREELSIHLEEGLSASCGTEEADSEKTPTAPKAAVAAAAAAAAPPKMAPAAEEHHHHHHHHHHQQELAIPASPPKLTDKPPSPRASPKASLPTLKLQTSFQKPKPPPKRKTTPMPRRATPNEDRTGAEAASPAPLRGSEDDIEIVLHADDEDDDDDADFEDGELTARPPPSAVSRRSGTFWPGGSIDEVLGDRQLGGGGGGGGGTATFWRHHSRSSSMGLSPQQQQQQQQQQRVGPATPNGYEDISPITRGEWGFLMVSDPFKTKTAAVETF